MYGTIPPALSEDATVTAPGPSGPAERDNPGPSGPAERDNQGFTRVGVSSWSDRSLTHESGWYPKKSMKAAERIAYYSSRFSLVEMENTFRFPPTGDVARQWVERTPPGFRFDIQAWALLTGRPTMPASLWPDLIGEVRADRREHPRMYSTHLSAEALDECWRRFTHAITPLHEAQRLGAVILRYPRWFVPRDRNRAELAAARKRLGDLPAAVELGCDDWLAPEECEATLDLLDGLGFAFVSVDAATDAIAATSSDLGVMRLLGRKDSSEADWWSPDYRGYRYSDDELRSLATRISHMSEATSEMHVLVGTCWRDDAVTNAERLQEILA